MDHGYASDHQASYISSIFPQLPWRIQLTYLHIAWRRLIWFISVNSSFTRDYPYAPKMKLLKFLTPLALSAWTVSAWNGNCLSDQDAQSIADRSIIFLEHLDIDAANATAQGLFADNIQEFGDSINSLRGDAVSGLSHCISFGASPLSLTLVY